jgi:hypothetical protein
LRLENVLDESIKLFEVNRWNHYKKGKFVHSSVATTERNYAPLLILRLRTLYCKIRV